jgi:hypothetical protein
MDYWIETLIGVGLLILVYLVATGRLKSVNIRHKETELKIEGHQLNKSKDSYELARRFRRVLEAHEIPGAYWPIFFNTCKAPFNITHAEHATDVLLQAWLTEEKINWLCDLFLIRRDWMNGADCGPHEYFTFNKDLEGMLECIKVKSKDYPFNDDYMSMEVQLFVSSTSKNALTSNGTEVSIAYGIPICRLENEVLVYRWVFDQSSYPWGENLYQHQFLQFAQTANQKFSADPRWAQLNRKDFKQLAEGTTLVPEALQKSTRTIREQPYDYWS